ncbi:hypothetical protein CONLIGDRAFT_142316 [Coniochaeta ligniaria NRRL 30616]|uniref:Uncharacterized protein n=1 Tax=Coniochaeta ligniaria NRRL 30616 TaxID=1408157 RepID=A0A1J7J751_9PEZI|nr:hypothetical protein CONLIGDRAFT_142316 [Coniochaeta ligniaria NRRL 30616]
MNVAPRYPNLGHNPRRRTVQQARAAPVPAAGAASTALTVARAIAGLTQLSNDINTLTGSVLHTHSSRRALAAAFGLSLAVATAVVLGLVPSVSGVPVTARVTATPAVASCEIEGPTGGNMQGFPWEERGRRG